MQNNLGNAFDKFEITCQVLEEFVSHFDYNTLSEMNLQLREYRKQFPKGSKTIELKIDIVEKQMMYIYEQEKNL